MQPWQGICQFFWDGEVEPGETRTSGPWPSDAIPWLDQPAASAPAPGGFGPRVKGWS